MKRIAHEEENHAELAWCFVKWTVEQYPHTRPVIERFRAALTADWKRRDQELRQAPPTEPSSELNSFGYLHKNARLRLEQQALKALVLPCLDALLGLDGGRSVDSKSHVEALPLPARAQLGVDEQLIC